MVNSVFDGVLLLSAVARLGKRLTNPFHDALHVVRHVVVPEPEDAISRGFQNCGARRVSRGLFAVMSSVQLNYQPLFSAAKINDVTAYHELTRELEGRRGTDS